MTRSRNEIVAYLHNLRLQHAAAHTSQSDLANTRAMAWDFLIDTRAVPVSPLTYTVWLECYLQDSSHYVSASLQENFPSGIGFKPWLKSRGGRAVNDTLPYENYWWMPTVWPEWVSVPQGRGTAALKLLVIPDRLPNFDELRIDPLNPTEESVGYEDTLLVQLSRQGGEWQATTSDHRRVPTYADVDKAITILDVAGTERFLALAGVPEHLIPV